MQIISGVRQIVTTTKQTPPYGELLFGLDNLGTKKLHGRGGRREQSGAGAQISLRVRMAVEGRDVGQAGSSQSTWIIGR